MNKRAIIAGAVGTGLLGISAFLPLALSAQNADSAKTTFVQKLAEKLGLDQSNVQTAVDEIRTEVNSEKQAERKVEITQAVTNGKLTQRQADILFAVMDVEFEKPSHENKSEENSLSDETSQSENFEDWMETQRAEREQKIVDTLNAAGLNTTLEELKATQDAAKSANLRIGFGEGHRGAPGRVMPGLR